MAHIQLRAAVSRALRGAAPRWTWRWWRVRAPTRECRLVEVQGCASWPTKGPPCRGEHKSPIPASGAAAVNRPRLLAGQRRWPVRSARPGSTTELSSGKAALSGLVRRGPIVPTKSCRPSRRWRRCLHTDNGEGDRPRRSPDLQLIQGRIAPTRPSLTRCGAGETMATTNVREECQASFCTTMTVTCRGMPSWSWTGLEQKNLYVPGLS